MLDCQVLDASPYCAVVGDGPDFDRRQSDGNLRRMHERLAQQIAFLVEADKLKSIIRRTPLVDVSRLENSAEHSWHLVLVIMVLREDGPPGVDWMRVMEMVAVHDLVEIDAGDVSVYDVNALPRSRCANRRPPTGFSVYSQPINTSAFDNCGTSSRRMRRRKRGSRTPSIDCSRSFRTPTRAAEVVRADARARANPATHGAD